MRDSVDPLSSRVLLRGGVGNRTVSEVVYRVSNCSSEIVKVLLSLQVAKPRTPALRLDASGATE